MCIRHFFSIVKSAQRVNASGSQVINNLLSCVPFHRRSMFNDVSALCSNRDSAIGKYVNTGTLRKG